MTYAEKKAFLEREGWAKIFSEGSFLWLWTGPSGWPINLYTSDAYQRATRRRQARDRARLRKAGLFCHLGRWFYRPFSIEDDGMSRQEAIAYLDRMEGK